MSTNVDAMVRAGVDAYKGGNKAEARALLERAIELDGYNETAWLWLSAVVETKEEQQTCLENVLIINPDNSRARQGLQSLGVDPDSVLAQTQGGQEAEAPAVEEDGFDFGVDAFDQPFDTEDSTTFEQDDVFGDIDFSGDDDEAFGLSENIFAEESYDETEDFLDEDVAYAQADYGDIGDAYIQEDSGEAIYDEAVFDDGDDMYADISTYENYTDAVGDDLQYDDSQFAGDPFAEPEPEPAPPVREELTPEQLYGRIPPEIEPTRAPGVVEAVPQYHYIVLGVLGVINVGALLFVVFQFAT